MVKKPFIGVSTHYDPGPSYKPDPVYAGWEPDILSIARAGGIPVLYSPVLDKKDLESLLEHLDGLVISGGNDVNPEFYHGEMSPLIHPIQREQDVAEVTLAQMAVEWKKPLLAICRGAQILNVSRGGTLYGDLPTQYEGVIKHRPLEGEKPDASAHTIRFEKNSKLEKIFGTDQVTGNSFHHQAVRDVGEGLVVTAHAPDGVVEAVELPDHPFCIGVQWHPEIVDGNQKGMEKIFEAFVKAASKN